MGQQVKLLLNESRSAGVHHVTWDGTDHNGNLVPSGVYFYRMVADDFVDTRKMVLVR
jgi:flagellar hook assembly protein FlgD